MKEQRVPSYFPWGGVEGGVFQAFDQLRPKEEVTENSAMVLLEITQAHS